MRIDEYSPYRLIYIAGKNHTIFTLGSVQLFTAYDTFIEAKKAAACCNHDKNFDIQTFVVAGFAKDRAVIRKSIQDGKRFCYVTDGAYIEEDF